MAEQDAAQFVPVITIDGPSGSGKGTISQALAQNLGWHCLDSGLIYRVFAYVADQQAIQPEQEAVLLKLLDDFPRWVQMKVIDTSLCVFWQEKEISSFVRSEACGELASKFAALSSVRTALLDYQRAFRQPPGLVADGRDMGTVVFPDAILKIYLSASLEERAKRRYLQLKRGGKHVSLGAVQKELKQRDTRDTERKAAPLKAAENALVLDTTHLSIPEVLQRIQKTLAKKRYAK
jgi:CMP/dCMP kinase